jgi:transposase
MEVFKPIPFKEKRPQGRQPKFSLEYMMMIAKQVVDKDLTYREAAKMYGVSHGSIALWVGKYKRKSWKSAGRNQAISEEVHRYRMDTQTRELKHEIAELYLENLMLKKIIQHSQQIKRENSSVITSENLDQFKKGAK